MYITTIVVLILYTASTKSNKHDPGQINYPIVTLNVFFSLHPDLILHTQKGEYYYAVSCFKSFIDIVGDNFNLFWS